MARVKHRILYVRNSHSETISRIAKVLDKMRDLVIVEMSRLGNCLLGNRYDTVAVDELFTAVSPAALYAPHQGASSVRNRLCNGMGMRCSQTSQGDQWCQEWLKRPEQLDYG